MTLGEFQPDPTIEWTESQSENCEMLGIDFHWGSVPKRPKGADCKSAGICLRRFESFPAHDCGVLSEVQDDN